MVSILKRFTIYILIGLISVSYIGFNIPEILELFLDFNRNKFDLNQFFSTTDVVIKNYSISFLIIFIKFLMVSHLLFNALLFSFYYLNSFLLLQKYNSVSKFRGNDIIPDSLDFEHDGIQRVM